MKFEMDSLVIKLAQHPPAMFVIYTTLHMLSRQLHY